MGKVLPTSFGPYQIVALLGEGGSGQVFRARDPRLERDVALKILRERSGTNQERLRRFIAEARAASALNHPNIVTVYDAAIDGDTPFVVSELIDGRPLREEMERGSMPLKRVLELAVQVADGLTAAHEADIVHRDLKPENIMVTRSGRAKILDFGLARPGGFRTTAPASDRVVDDETQTQTDMGLRAGTIPYMSPEQACGRMADFRSDQFSLGLILYEMLAGRGAFRRETPAATLDAIVNDEAPMTALPARTPLPLRWLIERCLTKDPDGRYSATADLYRDLKTLRDRVADLSVPDTGSIPVRKSTIRQRVLTVITAVAALAFGVAISRLTDDRAVGGTARLSFSPFATDSSYEGSGVWSPDGQTIAYIGEANGILQVFTRRVSGSPSPAQVTDAPYDCKFPFWSPDSKRIYYVSLARDRDGLWSVGAAGGTPQVVLEDVARAALSPDGGTLAFLRDEQAGDIVGAQAVWLSQPATSEPWAPTVVASHSRKLDSFGTTRFVEGALAFSPDSRMLGISAVTRSVDVAPDARGWQFWSLPLDGRQPQRRLQWLGDVAPRVNSFTWLADSRHAVISLTSIGSPGADLWMADLVDDRGWPLTRGPDHEADPSLSPSGDALVFSRDQSEYDLIEIQSTGGAIRPLLATSRNESDPAWSADANLLAYVTDRLGRDEIWLRSTEGGHFRDRPLITQDDFGDDQTIMLSSPSFSSDGRRIAYQRNSHKPIWPLRIWISLTAGGEPVPLLPPTHEGYQSAPTWSPDGQWIAYTHWKDKEWMLARVRVGSGEEPVVLRKDGVPNATPHWSPTNDWITWETERGFVLVSPDGSRERVLSTDQWLVHTWSRDGSKLFGIKDTEELRLSLVSLDARTGASRVVADLGPSAPANNPLRGLALGSDGALATAVVRLRSDLWLLRGLRPPGGPAARFWPFRSP